MVISAFPASFGDLDSIAVGDAIAAHLIEEVVPLAH
jgi:hypothetical protein